MLKQRVITAIVLAPLLKEMNHHSSATP